jgi:hypothetical protein
VDVESLSLYGLQEATREKDDILKVCWSWKSEVSYWFLRCKSPFKLDCSADDQDTEILWSTLSFQPEFTATSANIGYGWWSHDIGGHHHGITVSCSHSALDWADR